MNKWISLLASVLVLAATALPVSASDHRGTIDQLRTVYGQYNEALLQRNGDEAARRLHPAVVAMYAEALSLARSAGERQLKQAPPHQRLIALYIRWQAPPQIVASDDPRRVIAFMVSEGVLRSDPGVSTDLRDFTVTDNEAFAFLYAQDRKTPMRVRFERIADRWLIDLTHLQSMADDIYRQMAERQHLSEDQALVNLVAAYTKKPVTDSIWKPLDGSDVGR